MFPSPRLWNWGTRLAGGNYTTVVNWLRRDPVPEP